MYKKLPPSSPDSLQGTEGGFLFGCRPPPKSKFKKKVHFVNQWHQTLYVICPSAEISEYSSGISKNEINLRRLR